MKIEDIKSKPAKQFVIFVDTENGETEVMNTLADNPLQGIWKKHLVEMVDKHEYGVSEIYVESENYLQFKWEVQFTPLDKSITTGDQIELVEEMIRSLRSRNYTAVVGSEFNDYLLRDRI